MTFFNPANMMTSRDMSCASSVRLRRGGAPQVPLSLGHIPRLGILFLSPPRNASAGIRAITLAMVATPAQVKPTAALLAPDGPDSYPHDFAKVQERYWTTTWKCATK